MVRDATTTSTATAGDAGPGGEAAADGTVGPTGAPTRPQEPSDAGPPATTPVPDAVAPASDAVVASGAGGGRGTDAVPVADGGGAPARRKLSSAGVMIAVLIALLGFTLVVQVKNNSADPTLAAARQEDLVRILSDLEAREERLRGDIAALEESQRQLNSGAQGRQAALQEATRRADELGILAGTLPARGPGLTVHFASGAQSIRAAAILDAVQELRGAGAEAMQIAGGGGSVRIVASTYFLDADGGVTVGGTRLTGPYTITVIGDPKTMRTALNIPGGVVASVSGDGGNVTIQEHEVVDVTALSKPKDLQHARPVS
ncbi:DUF881 domain-containing protein [Micromonospora pattaloongensis]|uniref:DUF881 domain-containing protein n=1 Tax=Micromonospora pattaloongensis TaxID=405436 RepID=UPI003CCBADF1